MRLTRVGSRLLAFLLVLTALLSCTAGIAMADDEAGGVETTTETVEETTVAAGEEEPAGEAEATAAEEAAGETTDEATDETVADEAALEEVTEETAIPAADAEDSTPSEAQQDETAATAEDGEDVESEASDGIMTLALDGEDEDAAATTAITEDGGELASGSYTLSGDITLTSGLVIPSGAAVTIDLGGYTLTGSGSSSVITVNGSLTLTNGTVTGGSAESGGGIYVADNAALTMESVTVSGNKATGGNGGGIYAGKATTVSLTSCAITGNTAVTAGGGICINIDNGNTASLTITNSTISGNTANMGGGIYARKTVVTITGSTISNNSTVMAGSGGGGGGMNLFYATLNMSGSTVTGNTSTTQAGGIYFKTSSTYNNTLTVTDSIVSGNSAANGDNLYVAEGSSNIYYIVDFSSDGSVISSQIVLSGSTVTAPEDPTRDGYTFEGWYTDEALTEAYDFETAVTGDITLYAKWEEITYSYRYKIYTWNESKNQYKVNTYRQNKTSTTPEVEIPTSGLTFDKDITISGVEYEFVGWRVGKVGNYVDVQTDMQFAAEESVIADISELASNRYLEVFAVYEAVTYTVTFDSNGGSEVDSQTVTSGSAAAEPDDPTLAGYTFEGWYTDEELTEEYDFDTAVTADISLYAKWEQVTVIVDGADQTGNIDLASLLDEDGNYDFSLLALTDTSIFPEGEDGAYLVTIGEETQLVGNTTLSKWVGTWEDWQKFIYPDEETLADYPYLDEVWDLAYEAYIAAFYSVSEAYGQMVESLYPDTDTLKAYWYAMTDTKGVESIQVTADGSGYVVYWLDENGGTLASDSYTMTGKVLNGLEGATIYVFTADNLSEGSEYKYWVTMEPDMEGTEDTPIAAHYHFQFGSSLDTLLKYGQLYNSTEKNISDTYWYATMINAEASDLAKYNVILGMHRAAKWSELPEEDEGTFAVEAKDDDTELTVTVENGEALLTAADEELIEAGSDIEYVLAVADMDAEDVSSEDQAVITAAADGEIVGEVFYMDITLERLVNGEFANYITETDSTLYITVSIPAALAEAAEGTDGAYVVIRLHEGVAEALETTDNGDGTLTFATDLFSTYAIAYIAADDTPTTSPSPSPSASPSPSPEASPSPTPEESPTASPVSTDTNGDSGSSGKGGSNGSSKSSSSGSSKVKTGDETNIALWAVLLVCGGLGLGVTVIAWKRREH